MQNKNTNTNSNNIKDKRPVSRQTQEMNILNRS